MECGGSGEDLLKFCRQYIMDALYFDLRDRQLIDTAVAEERVLKAIEKHFWHLRISDRIALRRVIHDVVAECKHDSIWGQICISQVVDALLGREVVPDYMVKMDTIGEKREPQTEQGKALAILLKELDVAGEVRVAVVYTGQGIFPIQDLEGEFSADRKMIYVVAASEGRAGFVPLSDLFDLEDGGNWVFADDYFKALFRPLLRSKKIIA